jgi:hypothetical protein
LRGIESTTSQALKQPEQRKTEVKVKYCLLLVLTIVVGACEGKIEQAPQIQTERFIKKETVEVGGQFGIEFPGYQISSDRCSTGARTFDSKAEFCEGVRSKSLNEDCGAEQRKALWLKHCITDVFVELP